MRLVIKEKNKLRINRFIDWFLYMVGYTIVLIGISSLFKSIHIDTNHFLFWAFSIVLVTYVLNKTIKPILVTLTIPITGITLGLFYPFINLFILKLVDWILQSHFELDNIYVALIAAILISITNFVMEKIIENIINKVKNHE